MTLTDICERINFDEVDEPLARAAIQYIMSKCSSFMCLSHACRLNKNSLCGEIINFKIKVDLPQRPSYPIRAEEDVAVCFWKNRNFAPMVFVLRDDFPDTPHQVLVPDGWPAAICIDDRPWQDVRSNYTAAELISRILVWFNKACEGELHGADQPFDPVFMHDGSRQVVLSSGGHQAIRRDETVRVWKLDEAASFLLLTSADVGRERQPLNVLPVTLSVQPERMKRIRTAPNNVADLIDLLKDRGADLTAKLRDQILQWLDRGESQQEEWITCILAELPQIHPSTGLVGAGYPLAFVCPVHPGVIGQALGFLASSDAETDSQVGYVRLFGQVIPDQTKLEGIPVQYAPVHFEMDAERASVLAGRDGPDLRKILLIGAGSLGSSVAEILVREGLFR